MTSLAATSPFTSGRARTRRWPGERSLLRNLRITFSGLLYVVVLVLVGLAALNGDVNLLFLLVGMGLGVLVVNAVLPGRMVRRIEVERIAPEAAVAGRPFRITYVVRNRRRWTRAWSLVIGEVPPGTPGPWFPRGYVPVLEPGQERRLELIGCCPRRGRLKLRGVRVQSRFPFGLFSCRADTPMPAEVVVYPTVGRFRRDPWKESRYGSLSSSRVVPERGGQEEFYGVREYREGDSHRWIHWRRSARTGQLVIREMMPWRQTSLIVVVDPWPGARDSGAPRRSVGDPGEVTVERVISAAATAVCEGLERGHRVGLICRCAVPLVIAPAGGRGHRQRLLHELVSVEAGPADGLDEIVSRIRWSTGWQARCLICVPRVDATHERVARVLSGRTESTIVLSAESEVFDTVFDAAEEPIARWRGR